MRKSFTRLLSLVMFLTLLSTVSMAAVTSVWPSGSGALTKTTDKILVVYPEAVKASTGSVRVTKTVGSALVAVLPATDSRISYAKGDTVVIDLSASLQELTDYTVTLDAATFKTVKDGTDQATYSWTFKTGDYTAPTLKAVDPVSGTTLLTSQTTVALAMTFEDASAVVAATGKVAIYKADGNLWDFISVTTASTVTSLGSNLYKIVLPTSRVLEDNTTYAVTITSGTVTDGPISPATSIRADSKVNSFIGLTDRTVWTFTTRDYSAPGFASGYPKKGTVTNNAAGVLIKTAEAGKAYAVINTSTTAIAPSAIKADGAVKSVTIATAGTEYSIDFTSPVLSEGTQYYIHVCTENADGILSTAEAQVAVKTSETTAPTLTAVEYFKGTTSKAVGTVGTPIATTAGTAIPASFGSGFAVPQDVNNIVLTFSEDVKIGAGNVIIYKASDNSVFATVAASSLTLSGDNVATVAVETPKVNIPVSGLQNNTKYYVTIPNTLILDSYDNKFAGISTVSYWAFTTDDTVAPAFTYTPVEGALAQKQDVNIVLTFNELIRPYGAFATFASALTVEQFDPATSLTTTVTGAVSSSDNDGKFTTITIAAPVGGYVSSANVTVKVALNSLADVGNNVVDVAGQGINFVVVDKAAPLITSWSALTDPSKSMVLTFNEAIYLAGGGEITDATLPAILTVKKTDISGVNVPYTATIDAAKKKITITPSTPWTSEQQYYFAITSDLQDAAGNAFAGAGRTAIRTIADVTPATVDLSSVDGKTISTGDPITLTFIKTGTTADPRSLLFYSNAWNAYALADMNKVIVLKEGSATGADVSFTVTNDVTGFVGDAATFAIHATLAGNKTYYLGVGASTKGTDNNINVVKFVTFSTKEEGAPTATLSPADNSVQVAKSSNFVLTFNTGVKLNSAYATGDVYFSTDGTTHTKDISSAEITFNADGTVATINPSSDLSNDLAYDLIIDPAKSVFQNKNTPYVAFAGLAANAWDFVTTDTKLDITSLVPDNGAVTAIDSKLEMNFSEKVVKGLGTFKIWNTTTNNLVESIDVVSSQVVLSDDQKKITITPSANFSYNTTYYVEVTAGTLKDAVGNGNLEIHGTTNDPATTNWTFGTANPALSISKMVPAKGADKVAANSSIVITFNREIAAVTPPVGTTYSVGYYEGVTGGTPQSYTIGSSNVIISGKTLTIMHPDKLFPDNTAIYVYLPAGVLQAANDNSITNSLVNQTTAIQYFNTGDVNAPVPTFTPAAFVSGTPVYTAVNSNITITFDEDIYNFAGGTAVSNSDVTSGGIFTISPAVPFVGTISGKTVTLDPTSDLNEFTSYTVSIVGDKIKDSKGTAITPALISSNPTTYTSSFWTADTSAPVITSFVLAGGNKVITVPSITVTDPNNSKFYYLLRVKSTDAAPTAAQIKAANSMTIAEAAAGFTISSLVASTDYQFYYVADDTFGNTSDVAVLEASTTDTVAPLLVSTTPATATVDVDVPTTGVVVKLTFNENVAIGTGVVTVRDYATQAVLTALTQTALSTVSGDSKSLNLTIPAATFTAAPQKFYVEISSGTITDAAPAHNAYAGLFGMDALALTSEDNAAPTVDTANSTTTGSNGVALDASIKVAFSENVKAGTTGNLILYKGSVAVANAIQVFTPAEATFSGKTATVKPTANLLNSQVYFVSTEAGFAKDMSSNSNANIADATLNFTTTANVLLSVTAVSPAGGTTAIAKTSLASIGVTFSGPVYLTVAGYHKALTLMTQAELLSHVSLVDGAGTPVSITQINKVGGNGITIITGTNAIKDQTNYTLTISGFENSAGTVMVSKVVNYVTNDATPPVITFNPLNAATKVDPATTGLTLTFSENFYADVIDADKGIWAEVNNSNVKNFVYLRELSNAGTDVPCTVTLSGKVITIVPTDKLKSGTVYFYGMLLPVEDITQAPIVLHVVPSTEVSFTTADVTAPKLATFTTTNHKPQGVGTSSTADMYVDFNEDIAVSTGSIVIRREDGTIFQTISGADLSVGSSVTTAPLDSKRLKIKHNAFESFTNYFVEVGASVVVDGSGNGNVKFSDPLPATGWLFTTNDTYALTATVTPKADNTPRSVNLEMMFNKVPTGVANKFIALYKADGTAVAQIATSPLVPNGRVISVPVSLDANQAYYARVEPGAFVDGSGNKFAGIMDNSWVFSTVNNIAPQLVTLAPADNALAVDASTTAFTMTFDRNVAVGTGVISVRYAVDGKVFEDVDVTKAVVTEKTLTFNVTQALNSNTAYYVYVPVGAITNTEITKDSFKGILNTYDWNFTTASDLTAPTAMYTPNGTTTPTTDSHPSLQMTFNEDVTVAAGNVKVYKASDNTVVATIPVTAAMLSGKTVSLTYANGLERSTNYYVLVDAGVVKDLAGNAFAGVTASTTWTFKTGADWKTPVVPEISDSQFKVYPNPFVDYVTVSNASELSKVVVSNIAGQIVKEVVAPESTIQLNELRSGVYFITLYQDGAVIKTVKILKR